MSLWRLIRGLNSIRKDKNTRHAAELAKVKATQELTAPTPEPEHAELPETGEDKQDNTTGKGGLMTRLRNMKTIEISVELTELGLALKDLPEAE